MENQYKRRMLRLEKFEENLETVHYFAMRNTRIKSMPRCNNLRMSSLKPSLSSYKSNMNFLFIK